MNIQPVIDRLAAQITAAVVSADAADLIAVGLLAANTAANLGDIAEVNRVLAELFEALTLIEELEGEDSTPTH
jgi:hypothetical protein